MEFTHSPLAWYNEGTEPPETTKVEGWLAGHRPPSAYFNHKWNKDYLSILELQTKLSALDATHTADKAETDASLALKATIESPSFTGTPLAPTPAASSNNTEIATTEFVQGIFGGVDFSALMAHTVMVQNPDLNTLRDDRAYICVGTMRNAPIPNTYCFLRSYDTPQTDRILQTCWVPNTNNTVRSFIRAVTGGLSFGQWQELSMAHHLTTAVARLEMLHDEDKFRNQSTLQAMNKAISTLFIETYETLNDINTTHAQSSSNADIQFLHDEDLHVLKNADADATISLVTFPKVVTGGRNSGWCFVDSAANGGSILVQISRDNGTTWTTLSHNTLTPIDSQPAGVQIVLKVALSGIVTLKNIAWGVK